MATDQSHQLSLISETLHLPGGVTFTPRGLAFSPSVTEQDLLRVGGALFAARSYLKWGLGSLFAAMIAARPHHDQRDHAGEWDDSWAIEFADAQQLDPKDRREMLGVFLFYRDCPTDTPPLSFEHHREAMWGADTGEPGALDRALAFLDWAQQQGATVTKLRRHIRTTGATEPVEPKQLDLAQYGAVFEFMRYAKRELPLMHTYTPERAALILTDLGTETIEYIDSLRSLASRANTSTNVPRGTTEAHSMAENGVAVDLVEG